VEPLARLIDRNRDRLSHAGPTLWVDPPPGLAWDELDPEGRHALFTGDEALRCRLAAGGRTVEFGAFPEGPPVPRIVLAQPREKARLRMMAHCLARRLAPNGRLYLAGENRAGARSAPRQLAPWFGQVNKMDSARHCILHEARDPAAESPFRPLDYLETWRLGAFAPELEVCTYPGVFAHGALDAGTRLLLEHLKPVLHTLPPGARVLDLGCGAGVIGAALLLRRDDLAVVLADSSALALAAARATLARNDLHAEVRASDGLRGVEGVFDLVVSNPPFHAGHRERADRGTGLFDDLLNFLNPGGQFIMVANRHLPWPRWMEKTLGHCDVMGRDDGFHVLNHRVVGRRRRAH